MKRDDLHKAAEQTGIQPRTLEQVKSYMVETKAHGTDQKAAALMLKHGRMTAEARDWLSQEYPQ